MDGQNLKKPIEQPAGEHESMKPEDLLDNMAGIGRSSRDYDQELQVMLKVAEEMGIPVDLFGNVFEVPDKKQKMNYA